MIDAILDGLIDREKGFVNHPADPGGATNWGITRKVYEAYLGRPATVADVKAMPVEVARAIYRQQYVLAPGFGSLGEPLRTQMVDFGVHSGQAQASKVLQLILGVRQDGVIGPATLAALNTRDTLSVARSVWGARLVFMAQIVEADVARKTKARTQAENIEGWVNRMLAINPWNV